MANISDALRFYLFSQHAAVNDTDEMEQLKEDARKELASNPPCYESLQKMMGLLRTPACDFNYTMPRAQDIANYAVLQNHPGSFNRLLPLAQSFLNKIEGIKSVLNEHIYDEDSLKSCFLDLNLANQAFLETYLVEYKIVHPCDPFSIMETYPKTIGIYSYAFLNQLESIPPDLFASWKAAFEAAKDSQEATEQILPMFYRLALFYLIGHQQIPIPEIFTENTSEIEQLQDTYQSMQAESKDELLRAIRGEADCSCLIAKEVFVKIGEIYHHASPDKMQMLYGINYFLYQESNKWFALLDQMERPLSKDELSNPYRTVFLCLLKQQNKPSEEELPFDLFKSERLGQEVLNAYDIYQQLTDEEREHFHLVFFKKQTNSPISEKTNRLLSKCKSIEWEWLSNLQFPLRLLPQIKNKQQGA